MSGVPMLMRIPYISPLPPPRIIPATARPLAGAIASLVDFLVAPLEKDTAAAETRRNGKTVLLTGAGISVASGLADYRGTNGTYTLNKTYRPIYYSEFLANHEARKRYWARSFLGWTNLANAKPNGAHEAVRRLGELGILSRVITQNVDSFHPHAHPALPTTELHGTLAQVHCTTCKTPYPRDAFQSQLEALNPSWADMLRHLIESGALSTEDPHERAERGLRTNPDGDLELKGVKYTTFRYPPCPACLQKPPPGETVLVDADGASQAGSTAGVLKPAVVMFGENVNAAVKAEAEEAIDTASRLLVVGSSLATYSAWRLAKRAKDRGLALGMLNLGGVRGEDEFFLDVTPENTGRQAVRIEIDALQVLPGAVKAIEELKRIHITGNEVRRQ
ncbi:DHS-like NAD/FAD-binding domain-containing protein [Eremomyces bilateralis CBS 781.70]|uniref:DHS-like NAD/FAD-binding domain-containing protein n=1 Tax=Eremomyces bilateralis CBS 781.70 TaxID=1392243 RepID=A0A6G1G9Z6_9PEZI|nr:DHS-like NAD/FAD-binding domain-containing protein [Eremomyces bilateralis CBS 781.70]KAF1814895.1 DHS-like NAD/FAD-binding domain-containing protein [Eremomyces bilateralis CBS 781.70]